MSRGVPTHQSHAAFGGDIGEEADAPDDLASALCERSLVAMARDQWDRAHVLAGRARTVLRRAGIEESYATPLVCAVRARVSMHRGDVTAARRELITTAAELRLLPLLSTHLSSPEIGQELFLSRSTIKTEAMSIYRKLGASSRSQAVTRSRELGLLEG